MIRWTRLTLAAVAASTLTVLAQAPADAGAPDLPRPAHGADAIRLLGDDLVAAAEANGLSSAELRRILREDPTAWLDRDARMYYVEPTDAGAAGPASRAWRRSRSTRRSCCTAARRRRT